MKSIKRITHRIIEELDATRRIAKVTTWTDAFFTLIGKVDIQIMNRNGYKESSRFKKHLLRKHEIMMQYFEHSFTDFICSYDFNNVQSETENKYSNVIWLCCWQGIEQAPELVRKCIDSMINSTQTHQVIIITEDNYKNYVTFPEYIEQKRESGIISRTHYSDLLRLTLLSRYGGIWLDSTFFCTGSQIEEYFSWPLWSIKRPDYYHASIASGYFANYSLGCNLANRKIFMIIRDFVLHYWETNDIMIDYLLLDYLIVLAQRHSEYVKSEFEKIHPNNPQCDELHNILGSPYDKNKWDELKKETYLFKLSWKNSYPKEHNGKRTFYNMLLTGELK